MIPALLLETNQTIKRNDAAGQGSLETFWGEKRSRDYTHSLESNFPHLILSCIWCCFQALCCSLCILCKEACTPATAYLVLFQEVSFSECNVWKLKFIVWLLVTGWFVLGNVIVGMNLSQTFFALFLLNFP